MKATAVILIMTTLMATEKSAGQTDLTQSTILVTTDVGMGSGFLATIGKEQYVVSNAHVVNSATNIMLRDVSGQLLKITSLEFAEGLDLVRFQIASPHSVVPLPVRDQRASIGDQVSIVGNSQGMNVLTKLTGQVLGVGPEEIEIDCDFVPGNSGSPVVDQAGNVLGVATYIVQHKSNWFLEGTRFDKPRRFALRLNVQKWIRLPLEQLYYQNSVGREVCHLIDDLIATNPIIAHRLEMRTTVMKYDSNIDGEKYINKDWPKRIELFCDLFFSIYYNDNALSHGASSLTGRKIAKSAFIYKDSKMKRDTVPIKLCDEAVALLTRARGKVNYATTYFCDLEKCLITLRTAIAETSKAFDGRFEASNGYTYFSINTSERLGRKFLLN